MKEFESMVEQLEELEDINLYDQVKKSDETSLPINKSLAKIPEPYFSQLKETIYQLANHPWPIGC
ncbi:hypothetical protein GCM10027454_31750 [Algoriphagus aestuariicola]